jgi:ABC-type lipoprotein release transport system permease subunit
MNALRFAWRSLVRQPARASLGVIGVAAVGALLFDMLMLSNGLVLSMQTLLGRSGFTLRVSTAGSPLPGTGQPISEATETAAAIAALPEVAAAVPVRFANSRILRGAGERAVGADLVGVDEGQRRIWTLAEGGDLGSGGLAGRALVNENLAALLSLDIGDMVHLQANCGMGISAAPAVHLPLAGVADFELYDSDDLTVALTLQDVDRACGGEGRDAADQILINAAAGVADQQARVAIERHRPDLQAFTNDQLVARLQEGGLSYFRQISLVLTTVTITFAFLLVTVLLTVSVNQRVGEIAALRALGLSQRRVIADVFCESVLLVGTGALLAVPAGFVLARGLDRILKGIPGVPDELHFFVYEPRALWIHVALFSATALLAAAYPMRMVANLPIAGTLRKEVIG